MSTWDILIATIPHRHEKLCELLGELSHQIYPGGGVSVRLYRDNLETPYGDKTRILLESSHADYVSCFDDDDWPAPFFVARVMQALTGRPDYVGFPVRWTQNGVLQVPVEHSLRHNGWSGSGGMLCRDIAQFNPIRRELALLGHWSGGNAAEVRWGDGVRSSGQCTRETWIPEPMYYYQENTMDTFKTAREPLAIMPELPRYPWLTVL